jgi:predicted phosphoribosyltransferase
VTPLGFRDRREAGRALAAALHDYQGQSNLLVLALPRGGVPVGYEVASELHAPLDVFSVRKLGVPGREELAMGAIGSGGARVINVDVVESLGIPESEIERVAARELEELARREHAYRDDRPYPNLEGRTVIVVDDGLATGASMVAASCALRKRKPAKLVVAVPVGPADTCALMRRYADDVVCASTPERFEGVGLWYEDFTQTTDDEVRELLARRTRLGQAS